MFSCSRKFLFFIFQSLVSDTGLGVSGYSGFFNCWSCLIFSGSQYTCVGWFLVYQGLNRIDAALKLWGFIDSCFNCINPTLELRDFMYSCFCCIDATFVFWGLIDSCFNCIDATLELRDLVYSCFSALTPSLNSGTSRTGGCSSPLLLVGASGFVAESFKWLR